MEDALARNTDDGKQYQTAYSLNPCCNGRCTRTSSLSGAYEIRTRVLILVVMEDALALTTMSTKKLTALLS